jgi:hypothetical protein
MKFADYIAVKCIEAQHDIAALSETLRYLLRDYLWLPPGDQGSWRRGIWA